MNQICLPEYPYKYVKMSRINNNNYRRRHINHHQEEEIDSKSSSSSSCPNQHFGKMKISAKHRRILFYLLKKVIIKQLLD